MAKIIFIHTCVDFAQPHYLHLLIAIVITIIIFMIVTENSVCNSIFSIHLERGVVGSITMVSLVRMVNLAL